MPSIDGDGTVVQVNATYDPETRGGTAPDGRKVKSTMHWVSVGHARDATVHLYDRLFVSSHPGADGSDPLDVGEPACSRDVCGQGRTGGR